MADESQELPRVNWSEVLAFTHVFKSFRMAIHVSKLALALAAVLLIWLWGSVLDTAGGWAGTRVPAGEIVQYVDSSARDFQKWEDAAEAKRVSDLVNKWSDAHSELVSMQDFLVDLRSEGGGGRHLEDAFQAKLIEPNQPTWPTLPGQDERQRLVKKHWSKAVGNVEELFAQQVDRIEALIEGAEAAAENKIDKDPALNSEAKEAAEDKLAEGVLSAGRALTLRKLRFRYGIEQIRGSGVFEALKAYEGRCLSNALLAVRCGNMTGGLAGYQQIMDRRARMFPEDVAPPNISGLPAAVTTVPADETPGLLFWVLMMLNGLCWLIARHWLMAILLLGVALAVWALLGGAIHRMAALHFGRGQKISIGQALRFSASKFLSFYFAPLIPLGIILVIGALLAGGGLLLGNWVGGILMGLLLPLALIGGLLIAFLLVGLGGGGALMYPTIAVESSDSFDAIGRSYSYVYGRPWRAAFYSLVATVYGVICYLFVRFCAYLTLAATRWFIGIGVFRGGQTISPMANKLDILWPAPTFDNLLTNAPGEAMGGVEPIGAWLIWLWTMFVAATVLAFLLSFFASATTSIYFLLRRRIDATDLDDVYVDEPPDEFGPEPTEEPTAPAPEEEPPAKPEVPEEKPPAKPEAPEKEPPAKPEAPEEESPAKSKGQSKAKPEGEEPAGQ